MAEAENEKQTTTGQGWPYRTELGRTTAGSPFLKIVPVQGDFGERQIAACIYEIAAELERRSDDLGVSWTICAEPSDSKITIELSRERQGRNAEDLINQVLTEMQIPS